MNFISKGELMKSFIHTLAAVLAAFTVTASAAVDPALPAYKTQSGISGNLTSVGSDTLNNLMALWAEQYKRYYPAVNIQIQGAGSSTAPPALIEAASNLGPMSRHMNEKEITAFEKKYGYKPTAVPVAIDALAVYVHKDNPIKGLSIQQVDAIMSATRKCGGSADISKWGQVGITGELSDRTIAIYGRNSVSGTYGYFKSKALCKGDFRTSVAEQPGSASVVQSVSSQITAIGYSGIGYMTSGVRAVPLAKGDGKDYIAANAANASDGSYPSEPGVDCVCEQSTQSCLGSHHSRILSYGVKPTRTRDRGQRRLCAFACQDGCQSIG
jgi:phosphate transport system substrate-binding protein